MRILLPVDGSDHTKRMLGYIAAHDELLGADHEYLVFTAVAPVPSHAARFLDADLLTSYYRDQAEEVLGPVRKFAERHGWKVQTNHSAGHAAEAISHFADLIVMGTHGHGSLGNVLLGSVATGVLARCRVPVLLIR